MPIDWSPFVEIVNQHQRFLLTTHVRPDADGLGSMLALAEILERRGKQVQMLVASNFPPQYRFLDPQGRIEQFAPPGEAHRAIDAVIVLDTGTWNQLGSFGPFLKSLSVTKAVIDHHQTQDDLAAVRLVDISAEATGRLTYEAMGALGESLTPTVASNLFVALATDTGWFRHANATAATFALASELIEAGASPEKLYEELYERVTLGKLKLTSVVLDRLQVIENGQVAFTEILLKDYESTGAIPLDSENLINYTRSIAGVEVGIFLMEQPRGGVKVSFRSRARVDVARVAELFGGGGHRLAAGAVVEAPLPEARRRVLDAVRSALNSVG